MLAGLVVTIARTELTSNPIIGQDQTHTPMIITPIVTPHIAMAMDTIVLTITHLVLIRRVGTLPRTMTTIIATVTHCIIGVVKSFSNLHFKLEVFY